MNYKLFDDFITLQAILKELGIIQSGGAIKAFLQEKIEEHLKKKEEKERIAKLVKQLNQQQKKQPTKTNKKEKAIRFPGIS